MSLVIPTSGGRRDSRDLMAELFSAIQPQGRSGWVPATDHAWLEELREQHEAAVVERVRTMSSLPGALRALDAADERWAAGAQTWARGRSAALSSGSIVPAQPEHLTDAQCARRLDPTWEPINDAHQALATVVDLIGRTVATRAGELDRTYLQHARLEVWSGPGMQGVAGWFDTVIREANSGELAFVVSEIADWVERWRPEVDPVGSRRMGLVV